MFASGDHPVSVSAGSVELSGFIVVCISLSLIKSDADTPMSVDPIASLPVSAALVTPVKRKAVDELATSAVKSPNAAGASPADSSAKKQITLSPPAVKRQKTETGQLDAAATSSQKPSTTTAVSSAASFAAASSSSSSSSSSFSASSSASTDDDDDDFDEEGAKGDAPVHPDPDLKPRLKKSASAKKPRVGWTPADFGLLATAMTNLERYPSKSEFNKKILTPDVQTYCDKLAQRFSALLSRTVSSNTLRKRMVKMFASENTKDIDIVAEWKRLRTNQMARMARSAKAAQGAATPATPTNGNGENAAAAAANSGLAPSKLAFDETTKEK